MGQHNKPGLIYIMTNPSMPFRVKVGLSKDVEQRRRSLSYHTGVPEHYEVYRAFIVDNMKVAETICHDVLAPIRVNPKREYFEVQNAPFQIEYECEFTGSLTAVTVHPLEDLSDFLEQAMYQQGVRVQLAL